MKNYQSGVKEAVDSQGFFSVHVQFHLEWLSESVGRACIGLGYCWLVGRVSQGVKLKGSVKGLKGQLVH